MSAQIHDLGYRSYTGERLGTSWAIRSLTVHTIRRALGLKRTLRNKIAPAITAALAYLPALAMAGIALFLGGDLASQLVSYGDYIGIVMLPLVLFSAAVTPGVLTTDRLTGMLALYMAAPLTRTTYVLARALGVFVVMLIVTVGPVVLLMVGYMIGRVDTGGILGALATLGRALLAGSIAAGFFTGLSIFISSFPKRWGMASVAIVASLIIPGIVVSGLDEGIDLNRWYGLLSPVDVMIESWQRIFGDDSIPLTVYDYLPAVPVVAAAIGYAALALAATWWRYQRIRIER